MFEEYEMIKQRKKISFGSLHIKRRFFGANYSPLHKEICHFAFADSVKVNPLTTDVTFRQHY